MNDQPSLPEPDDALPLIEETIPDALVGERLDRVVSLITGMPRTDATGLIAEGGVAVNGKVATARTVRMNEGDEIVLRWEPSAGPAPIGADPDVEVVVVYEDDDVIVVDKQAGLVVHPGSGNQRGTLAQGLLARYPELAEVGEPGRPGIVHRLDKDTSGLLMAARSQAGYESLVAQLAGRTVHRRYQTLVWGHLKVVAGTVDAPIGRSLRDPTRMTVSERGRDAVTHYRVDQAYDEPVAATLLNCRLETGRTHQIRVHLHAIGHPVIGDDRYQGRRASLPTPRMFLHAAELGFVHPDTGEELTFSTPLPADLQSVLDRLST